MATEDLVIPGLTIAQRAGSVVNGRHAQEATPSKEVTGHSPELINNMRRLLVPLIVKKAEQGLSSTDRLSTTIPDLAQQADAIVTTKVCDDFIRQAIASVKGLKDSGKIPNGDHLAIQDKNIGLSTATRSPTPLPPGLGIKTQSWAGISTATVGVLSPPTDPSKPMLPDHPTPNLPRAMRVKRFPRSPSQDGPSRSPAWKGKEKAPFSTSSRPKSPWRRPRSPSPAPRSVSAHRRSPFPTNMGSNLDRRPSPPRGEIHTVRQMIGALALLHGEKLPIITLPILTGVPLRRPPQETITGGEAIHAHLQSPRLSEPHNTEIGSGRGQGLHHLRLVQIRIACRTIKEKLIHLFVAMVP